MQTCQRPQQNSNRPHEETTEVLEGHPDRSAAFAKRPQVAVLGVLLFMAMHSYGKEEPKVDPRLYDWVPVEELNEEQRAHLSPACSGAYVDPLAGQEKSQDLESIPLHVDADKVDMTTDRIILEGAVSLTQGNRLIHAESMSFDRKSDQADLDQDVMIRQPGILVRGDSAHVNTAGQEARFSGGEFVLHEDHLHGSAGNIEHHSDGVVVLQKGRLTSCEPGSETWQIKGEELRIDPNTKQGSGKHVYVEVAGVPILYVPYFTFPVGEARQSGFLTPAIGTSESGIDITLPWYWNIAPNYDATIGPRYASGHGAMLETEFRYLNSFSLNNFSFGYLPNDKGGGDPDLDDLIDEGSDEALLRAYRGEDRWLAKYTHSGGDNSRWYSMIDYARVSDVDYFRDISPESFAVSSNTYLSQSAKLGYRLQNWDISAHLQTYQNLLVDLDENYRQLPRMHFNGRYTWGAWGLSLNNEWVSFTHSDPSYITGQRANIDYQFEWNQQWQWGYMRPQFGIQSLAYTLKEDNLKPQANSNPTVSAPYVSLDTTLIFESKDGQTTLEPRLFYLYRREANHDDLYNITDPAFGETRDVNFDTTPLTFGYDQMFRARRFAGGDRLGDANQLTLALTSRWLDQSSSTSRATISFGQVFYFADQKVTLNYSEQVRPLEESDLASKVTAQLTDEVRVRGDFLYNPKEEQMMRATTGLEYQDRHQRRLRLDYRFVREDPIEQSTLSVDQLDTAFALPFGEQWQIVGRLFYDLDTKKELDAFLGFEYDDCCYRLRFLARRWLDSKLASLVTDESKYYDGGLFLEVDLKGLASSGKRIQNLLSENIPGFRDRLAR